MRIKPSIGVGRKAGSWRKQIAYIMAFSVPMYLLFLWSMSSTLYEPGSNITQDLSAGNVRSVNVSSKPAFTISVDQLDIEMAEFAYENQKGERSDTIPIEPRLARYGANWPCFWGETAVGDLKTWQNQWVIYKDGWKVRHNYFRHGVKSALQPDTIVLTNP